MGRRRDVVGSHLGHLGDEVRDGIELARKMVELVGCEVEAGEARQMRGLGTADRGHAKSGSLALVGN